MNVRLLEKIRDIDEIVQLDFEHDNKLFIDPYRINEGEGELFARAKKKIINFFDLFFECIERNDKETAFYMGKPLHEINATKLGYSRIDDLPRGKGFSRKDLLIIFDEAIKIKDFITDMPDILILAEKVGPDKVSDLTTNIIYKELIEYTIYIADKYQLEIELVNKRKWIFNAEEKKWIRETLLVPHIENEEIIFLPKKIVERYEIFSYENVYRDLVYPFYKANPAVHRLIRVLKNKEEVSDCKKLRKKYPANRETVRNFKLEYPERYKQYKNEMKKDYWRHEFK